MTAVAQRRKVVLDAIADAEIDREDGAKEARQQREQQATNAADRQSELRAEIADHEARRIEALGRAESAAREMSAALAEVLECADTIRKAAVRLRPGPALPLTPANLETRIARYVLALIKPLSLSSGPRFGDWTWRWPPKPASASWIEQEDAAVRATIDDLTTEKAHD